MPAQGTGALRFVPCAAFRVSAGEVRFRCSFRAPRRIGLPCRYTKGAAMRHAIEDVEYAEYLFDRFYGIGSCESGGVTRLGYTEVEDEMHHVASSRKKATATADQTLTYLYRTQYSKDEPYWLVGSPGFGDRRRALRRRGGGIIAGLLVMSWAERDGLDLPVRVGAMRCEESSNFGRSTIGSGNHQGNLQARRGRGREQAGRNAAAGIRAQGHNPTPDASGIGLKESLSLHSQSVKSVIRT